MRILTGLLFFYLFIANADAIQINQILRKKDNITRESAQKDAEYSRTDLRQKAMSQITDLSFYIHQPVICNTKDSYANLTSMNKNIVGESKISIKDILDSPVTFYVFLEVIKAHLDISYDLYKNGKFVLSDNIRYHSLEELKRYPDSIIKNPVDDVFKSIFYIKYVLMPILEKFASDEQIKTINTELDFLINPDVYNQKYVYYKESIDLIKKNLDEIFFKLLPDYKTNLSLSQIRTLTAIRLLNETLTAYKNSTSCPYFTKVLDPYIDPYELPLPDYHNNYVMGFGLFNRAEILLFKYIVPNKSLGTNERIIITKTIEDFRKLYPSIIKKDSIYGTPSDAYIMLDKLKMILKKKLF